MEAFIKPPDKIPFYLKIGIWITKKVTGMDLLPPKLLSWYPKLAISSGVLESLVAHGRKDLNRRILKLVRLQTAFAVACPFCIDMNSLEHENLITEEELDVLKSSKNTELISTFSLRERLAIEYARFISGTPIIVPAELINKLKENFTERELVILAGTTAQVNYWARLLQALGVPPAGFTSKCDINNQNI